MGDLAIVASDVDDPQRLGRSFSDSACDQWWLAYLHDVHGIDLSGNRPPPPLPRLVFDTGRQIRRRDD